jgi:hypothetical protein
LYSDQSFQKKKELKIVSNEDSENPKRGGKGSVTQKESGSVPFEPEGRQFLDPYISYTHFIHKIGAHPIIRIIG